MKLSIDIGSDTIKAVIFNDNTINAYPPIKVHGRLFGKLHDFFKKIKEETKQSELCVSLTGSGAKDIAGLIGACYIDEVEAITQAVNYLDPQISHIIEIGAETQKYLSFYYDKKLKRAVLKDVVPGGKCAGGCGSFLDYMHKRLKYDSISEFAEEGLKAECPAGISGRCAVFAESDIVHHYQKGTPRGNIAAGIHRAVARNCRSYIGNNKLEGKVVIIGGGSKNKCLSECLIEELNLEREQVVVPDYNMSFAALGAVISAQSRINIDTTISILDKNSKGAFEYESLPRIELIKSLMPEYLEGEFSNITVSFAALGVDVGSVSTKAVVLSKINGQYEVLASYYGKTSGNPIEAVKYTIGKIQEKLEASNIKIEKMVSATTGSGRYLTGYFIGADVILDEITAQASGASIFTKCDEFSIFEIGGQDSKYIQIQNGKIVDFEMNWACAAGTGSLIEKHAQNLNINVFDFGDYALKGDTPPAINSNCAVFAESALNYFRVNNVSINNLCAGACLASANNYIIKVIRNRKLSDMIVFQGAVAFNKGMVAAFETLLKRPIIIPKYPHLTGAVGVAKICLEKEDCKKFFPGFKAVMSKKYNINSFNCEKCDNECSINVFEAGKDKFYQGDRCDKYSSLNSTLEKKVNLPNYFKLRKDILNNVYSKTAPKDALSVGFPNGLLFNEYYPFFKAFFTELGFNFITSDETNKKIISKGLEKTVAQPCFPIKVAHGHFADLLENRPDYIFLPAIRSYDKPLHNYQNCYTCTYIQTIPETFRAAFGLDENNDKIFSPTIEFSRGRPHLMRVFNDIGKKLGKNKVEIKKALEIALNIHEQFKKSIKEKGREILDLIPPEQKVFVVIARPYALYDNFINMDIAKKIQNEGYLALPCEFLSYEDEDITDYWPTIDAGQGQEKVTLARYLRNRKNLEPLVITYFGCGPDGFFDQMFKEELGRHYLTIQIDEHTSDTGVLTRIQAFLNSGKNTSNVDNIRLKGKQKLRHIFELKEQKKVWVPYMNEGAFVLAAIFRGGGFDADILPLSDDPTLSLARKYITGDVCIPMLYTTQYMLERVTAPDFSPQKEAFFQGCSRGACRYGLYYMLEKFVIDLICEGVDIVTIKGDKTCAGFPVSFMIAMWEVLVTSDLLEKMLLKTRPYETTKGVSYSVYKEHLNNLCEIAQNPENLSNISILTGALHHKLKKIVEVARKGFEKIEVIKTSKPRVGIVGEFFVRLHGSSNQDIVNVIEENGAEVWLAPTTEFFGYWNYITGIHTLEKWKDTGNLSHLLYAWRQFLLDLVASEKEKSLFSKTLPFLSGYEEISPKKVVSLGEKYVDRLFGGEAILSMGKSCDFFEKNMDGIISVGPFNCMPSVIVSGLSKKFRDDNGNIPFLNIEYDGFLDQSRDIKISLFLSQVRERFRVRAN